MASTDASPSTTPGSRARWVTRFILTTRKIWSHREVRLRRLTNQPHAFVRPEIKVEQFHLKKLSYQRFLWWRRPYRWGPSCGHEHRAYRQHQQLEKDRCCFSSSHIITIDDEVPKCQKAAQRRGWNSGEQFRMKIIYERWKRTTNKKNGVVHSPSYSTNIQQSRSKAETSFGSKQIYWRWVFEMILKMDVDDDDDDEDQSVEAGGPLTGVMSTSSNAPRGSGAAKKFELLDVLSILWTAFRA